MAKPPNSLDFDIIKKPRSKTDWTEATAAELFKCSDDPMYFMETFMKIQHPMRGALPFHPYAYQRRMITAMLENRFSILMTARQNGKTTCAAGYITWKAMFIPDSTILIVSNKFSQALEVMDRIRFCYENLPNSDHQVMRSVD
jgi:phage terminase large subunit-like protein